MQAATTHATTRSCLIFLLLLLCSLAARAQQQPVADITLRGTVTDTDAQTYRELPFLVPAGITRITVDFSYTGYEQKTRIDLGIFDSERFRGWSGGNKHAFTLSETDATPSYLPGPIRPGTWKLLLGIPNIEPGVTSTYEARISLARAGDPPAVSTFSPAPLRTGPAWYRGDLHMHDAHSDGSCRSQSGLKVPCPLYKTVEAAAARKLDFIAISDHNTTSHFNDERELQPYFDRLLLIPAREITTFHGHANLFGPTDFVDFRLGTSTVPDFDTIATQVKALHGILSINHPGAPTGAACMGCGWDAPNTDYRNIAAIEAINGASMDGPGSGIPFWQRQLDAGYRLTGIGGSDNHDADAQPAIGHPTTVIYASELSERAILDGLRAGHVFVDLDGNPDRLIEFSATTGHATATMGDNLQAPTGQTIHFTLKTLHLEGTTPEIVHDQPEALAFAPNTTTFDLRSDGKRHWVRINIRAKDGRFLILGNPIYINF